MKILLVDDDLEFLDRTKDILKNQSFEVETASSGKEAIEKIYCDAPSLVIIDVGMPEMDGFQVCRKIKDDILLNYIPVIILTGQEGMNNNENALSCGCDDYIIKPFNPEAFIDRVKWVFSRSSRDINANPLTRLPGNWVIVKKLEDFIKNSKKFAVLYLDINNFKVYNDSYGFMAGDNIIKMTAYTITNAVKCFPFEKVFIGHIGGDDFIVVINDYDVVEQLCNKIIEEFDRNVREFYNEEDRLSGFVMVRDRKGNESKYPLISIAIAVVTNKNRVIKHLGHVNQLGAELKRFVKERNESSYAVDRRKD